MVQYITIRNVKLTMTISYISQKAKSDEEYKFGTAWTESAAVAQS